MLSLSSYFISYSCFLLCFCDGSVGWVIVFYFCCNTQVDVHFSAHSIFLWAPLEAHLLMIFLNVFSIIYVPVASCTPASAPTAAAVSARTICPPPCRVASASVATAWAAASLQNTFNHTLTFLFRHGHTETSIQKSATSLYSDWCADERSVHARTHTHSLFAKTGVIREMWAEVDGVYEV